MGVRFAYTVPNPRSSPGFVKFGVPLLGTLPCWMAPSAAAWRACRVAAVTRAPRRRRGAGVRVRRHDDARPAAIRRAVSRAPDARQHGSTGDSAGAPAPSTRSGASPEAGSASGFVVTRVMTIQRYRVLALCDWSLPGVTRGGAPGASSGMHASGSPGAPRPRHVRRAARRTRACAPGVLAVGIRARAGPVPAAAHRGVRRRPR